MGKEALRLFPVWYEHKLLSTVSSASTVEIHITLQLFWISHLCLWLTRRVETSFKAAWLCAGDTKPPTEKGLPLNQNTKHKWKFHSTDKACPHFYTGPGVLTHVNFHSKCNGGDILEQMWRMTQRWRHPDRRTQGGQRLPRLVDSWVFLKQTTASKAKKDRKWGWCRLSGMGPGSALAQWVHSLAVLNWSGLSPSVQLASFNTNR